MNYTKTTWCARCWPRGCRIVGVIASIAFSYRGLYYGHFFQLSDWRRVNMNAYWFDIFNMFGIFVMYSWGSFYTFGFAKCFCESLCLPTHWKSHSHTNASLWLDFLLHCCWDLWWCCIYYILFLSKKLTLLRPTGHSTTRLWCELAAHFQR